MHINGKATTSAQVTSSEIPTTVQQASESSTQLSPLEMMSRQQQQLQQQQQQQQASSAGDPFDGSAEPIVYMSDNRMPVMMDMSSVIIYIIFAALLLALISILPGIRRKKMTSFVGLSTLLVVGASVLLSLDGSHWLTGRLQLNASPYGALTTETITGRLQVNIGLSSTNVTLYGHLSQLASLALDGDDDDADLTRSQRFSKLVDYNERFHWNEPDKMGNEHQQALRRGLPYPILTITEFLSQDSDGFNWMRQLRQAGYFTSLALYASLACWCLTAVVMCVLPVYLPHMMQITGALMMASVWIYTLLIESPRSFVIQLGATPMEFEFGHTYFVTFMAGALSMFSGVIMLILQSHKPHDQLTIMDCEDYVKNNKILYANNGVRENSEKSLASSLSRAAVKALAPENNRQGVVIPIGDIEANFSHKAN